VNETRSDPWLGCWTRTSVLPVLFCVLCTVHCRQRPAVHWCSKGNEERFKSKESKQPGGVTPKRCKWHKCDYNEVACGCITSIWCTKAIDIIDNRLILHKKWHWFFASESFNPTNSSVVRVTIYCHKKYARVLLKIHCILLKGLLFFCRFEGIYWELWHTCFMTLSWTDYNEPYELQWCLSKLPVDSILKRPESGKLNP
jgi:hypothetical protein